MNVIQLITYIRRLKQHHPINAINITALHITLPEVGLKFPDFSIYFLININVFITYLCTICHITLNSCHFDDMKPSCFCMESSIHPVVTTLRFPADACWATACARGFAGYDHLCPHY